MKIPPRTIIAPVLGLILAACSDSLSGPPPSPLDLTLNVSSVSVTWEPRASLPNPDRIIGRCNFTLQIRALGGSEGEVAIFRSGEWRRVRTYSTTQPLNWSPADFTDHFGVDRVRAGQTLTASVSFQAFNLNRDPWREEGRLRFEFPDGTLRTFPVSPACDIGQ